MIKQIWECTLHFIPSYVLLSWAILNPQTLLPPPPLPKKSPLTNEHGTSILNILKIKDSTSQRFQKRFLMQYIFVFKVWYIKGIKSYSKCWVNLSAIFRSANALTVPTHCIWKLVPTVFYTCFYYCWYGQKFMEWNGNRWCNKT